MNSSLASAISFAREQMIGSQVSAIIAMDEIGGIGLNGDLPWPRLKEDMQFFRGVTLGNVVIMGRKTYESLPNGPLPGRINFVISRSVPFEKVGQDVDHENLYWYRSLEEALGSAFCFHPGKRTIIIGGGELYHLALGMGFVKTFIVSTVEGSYKHDVGVRPLDFDAQYSRCYTTIDETDPKSIKTETEICIRTEEPSVKVVIYRRNTVSF